MKFLLEVLLTSVGGKALATFCQVSLNLSLRCLGTLEEDNITLGFLLPCQAPWSHNVKSPCKHTRVQEGCLTPA